MNTGCSDSEGNSIPIVERIGDVVSIQQNDTLVIDVFRVNIHSIVNVLWLNSGLGYPRDFHFSVSYLL